MSLHGSPRHIELARDFRIITTLQKQLDDLLLAWAKPNGLFFHSGPPLIGIASALNWCSPAFQNS